MRYPNRCQVAAESELRLHRQSSLYHRVRIVAKHAHDVFESRTFYAVSPRSEENLIKEAVLEQDFQMLLAFVEHGPYYQAGCIKRGVLALREKGRESELNDVHLQAANTIISAVVEALRNSTDINVHLDIELERNYTEMTGYAVVHHAEAEIIASLIRDRKVTLMSEMLLMLEGIRGLNAVPLQDGFL